MCSLYPSALCPSTAKRFTNSTSCTRRLRQTRELPISAVFRHSTVIPFSSARSQTSQKEHCRKACKENVHEVRTGCSRHWCRNYGPHLCLSSSEDGPRCSGA